VGDSLVASQKGPGFMQLGIQLSDNFIKRKNVLTYCSLALNLICQTEINKD
jgi:hypothetical protein